MPCALIGSARIIRRAEGSDTMLAWERFLTGEPHAATPVGNFVVSSWQRSLALGVDPSGRAAPLAARGDDVARLRGRHRDLMPAAAWVFADVTELFAGSRSIMVLTNAEGVVLEAVGDMQTLEQGQDIHLMLGGDWREDVVGTNGIGTALATGRPAQVHAAEHFCEGIKSWTCAGAPIYEPGTDRILGVVDISGPPATYQRNNLTLAVTTARQIETALGEQAALERMRLLEIASTGLPPPSRRPDRDRPCRASGSRQPGRIPSSIGIGERCPGSSRDIADGGLGRPPAGGMAAGMVQPGRVRRPCDRRDAGVPEKPRPSARDAAPPADRRTIPTAAPSITSSAAGAAMTALIQARRQLAGRRVPVLIEGETGVGKELLARAIHDDAAEGGRSSPSTVVPYRRNWWLPNCSATCPAPSPARPGRPAGAFRAGASGNAVPRRNRRDAARPSAGAARVLEEGVVYRIGDTHPRRVGVRLIAITNRTFAPKSRRAGSGATCSPDQRDIDDDAAIARPGRGYRAAGRPFQSPAVHAPYPAHAAVRRRCHGRPAVAFLARQCARTAEPGRAVAADQQRRNGDAG